MPAAPTLRAKYFELEPYLRRAFWRPLRLIMEIFHVLPLAAAAAVFFLLAWNSQIREVYLTYLENLSDVRDDRILSTTIAFAAAAMAFTLLSALLYAAHYGLSTMQFDVIYANRSNPENASRVRAMQRLAGVCLASTPWLAVVAGLYGLESHLRGLDEYSHFTEQKHLLLPSGAAIVGSAILLGLAVGFLLNSYPRSRIIQWAGEAISPIGALAWLLLLVSSTPKIAAGGFPAAAWIAVCYCAARAVLYILKPQFMQPLPWRRDSGVDLARRRQIYICVRSLIPWLIVAIYFCFSTQGLASASQSRTIIPLAMAWTLALALVVATLLDRLRDRPAQKATIVGLIVLLLVVAELASFAGVASIVSLYRSIGPLSSIAVELLLVIFTLATLAWLSQRSGFPALTLVVLALVLSAAFPVPIKLTVGVLIAVCALLVVVASLSRLYEVAVVAALMIVPGVENLLRESYVVQAEPYSKPVGELCVQFEHWLDRQTWADKPTGSAADAKPCLLPAREPLRDQRGRQPVYIVAVEGGGIYAVAAAALFLAKLQDRNPNFAKHVFAISGVSGGAIGAAIFQALARSTPETAVSGTPEVARGDGGSSAKSTPSRERDACSTKSSAGQPAMRPCLVDEVSRIIQDDHLSPIVASIFPDFFGASTRRAQTLAASFEESVSRQDPDAAAELEDSFADHWSPESRAPALVLNTTWVETGYRVAFAPFALKDLGDASLSSFSDRNMPGESFSNYQECAGNRKPCDSYAISLMDAAIDSARFPGMLPAASVEMNEVGHEVLWNFVDGGYSDNSGASTALALYRAILPIAAQRNVDVDVILVTNSIKQPSLDPKTVTISGTQFHDTLAPFDAVMKVRDGLSNEAVARICDFINQGQGCGDKTGAVELPLQIVEIDAEDYRLPLGMELSRTTFDLIDWMLGGPERCDSATGSEMSRRNSCVMKHVGDRLSQM
jgi:hypothetical protein